MSELARNHVDSVLKRALELSAEARERFLDETCDRDTDLRRAVERLLRDCESDDSELRPGGGASGPVWEALARDCAAQFALEPGELVGAYRVVRVLGHGGMATVYLAERADGNFEQRVALKVLDVSRDFDALAARFAQERRILARLEHPNIARLIDGGATRSGQPYVVMEYINGEAIDKYCDRRRLGTEARIALFTEVAGAVQFAHGQLIVHRDIKPSNIMVTADGEPKLLDFGIAKLLDPDGAEPVTRTALHPMTPEYASPEQVRGETLTVASDVYQLGYLLYELLTGRSPYVCDRRNIAAMVHAISNVEPARPSAACTSSRDEIRGAAASPEELSAARSTTPARLQRRLAGDLDTILLAALQKQPERRYPSVFHLRDDLRRHLEGLPVVARKDTLGYRTRKFVRRHRVSVAAAALVVVSLAAGFGVALWQAQEKAREAGNAAEVTRFLLSLFEQADPLVAQGEAMTVLSLLEQGSARVAEELEAQPATQADLYKVLGTVFHRLGAYDRALELRERALTLRTSLYGPDHPLVADVIADIGDQHNSSGNYREAIRRLRQALDLQTKRFGRVHEDVAATLTSLGDALGGNGEFDEGERLLREALAVRQAVHGAEHVMVAATLQKLGEILRVRGSHDEAEVQLREAVRQERRLLGQDHSRVAHTLDALASLLSERGNDDEAEALAREALAIHERVYGPDHSTVAHTLVTVAGAQHNQARFEEAAASYRRALSIQRAKFGEKNIRTAHTALSLAATLQAQGNFADAEQAAREAHAIFVESLGDEHRLVAVSLQVRGANLYELERLDEAEADLVRALDLTRKAWGGEHVQYANVLFDYGKVLLARGRLLDAEATFRTTVDRRRATFGDGSMFTADAQVWLARCLVADRRFAEAEPLLQKSYPILVEALGTDYPDTVATRRTLHELYSAWGKPAQAATYR